MPKKTANITEKVEKTALNDMEAPNNTLGLERQPEVKTTEPKYTAKEFIKAAQRVFGVASECVAAAFKAANKTELTTSEAKKIVKEFINREVK